MDDKTPLPYRILDLCKTETHESVDTRRPDFTSCILWQRSCQSTRPTVTDSYLGTVDARNVLYANYRDPIQKGWTAVPCVCDNARCLNPYHAEIVTEEDERCNNYLRAGERVATKISKRVTAEDRDTVRETVMTDMIFATYLLERKWNSANTLDEFFHKADRFALGLRRGVQKAKNKARMGKAFRIYCLTKLDLDQF